MQYLAVAVGAMLGANLRYLVSLWAADHIGTDFPYGTFIINVSGSFLIGLALGAASGRIAVDPLLRLFFVTGFLGGYTTFSSYAWEALTLADQSAWLRAGVYVIGSNVLGLIGVWVGAVVSRLAPT